MKYLYSICFLTTIFLTNNSFAQKQNYFEIISGIGQSSISKGNLENNGRSAITSKFKTAFILGFKLGFYDKKNLGFETGLFYSIEGFKKQFIGAGSYANDLTMIHPAGYLRIPLNLVYKGCKNNNVHPIFSVGLLIGLKLSDNEKLKTIFQTISTFKPFFQYKSFDLGFRGAFGLDINLEKNTSLYCGLNYYQGLADALKEESSRVVNSGTNLNESFVVQFGIKMGF